jgi:hypothetical protein
LCEQLLEELTHLRSGDDAAAWAKRAMPTKNRLTPADAQRVELGFSLVLSGFDDSEGPTNKRGQGPHGARTAPSDKPPARRAQSPVKRAVAPRSIRLRDPEHRKFVARQACLVCGRRPCDPHHLRFAQPLAMGAKVSDEFTVPLCRTHHREIHCIGDERGWWADRGLDALQIASALWRETRSARSDPIAGTAPQAEAVEFTR